MLWGTWLEKFGIHNSFPTCLLFKSTEVYTDKSKISNFLHPVMFITIVALFPLWTYHYLVIFCNTATLDSMIFLYEFCSNSPKGLIIICLLSHFRECCNPKKQRRNWEWGCKNWSWKLYGELRRLEAEDRGFAKCKFTNT